MNSSKGIIAIGAHPDDIEFGCGGTLAKLASSGFEVHAVVLSKGEEGNPLGADRIKETTGALASLGVKELHSFAFEDTRFSSNICDIINELVKLYERLSDDMPIRRVYTMSETDRHQDHRAVYDASIIAFRLVPQILCYETPSTWANFQPNLFEKLEALHLDQKINSLKKHKSQIHRSYMQEDKIRSVAMFRGQQAGYDFSEGFVPYKMVL